MFMIHLAATVLALQAAKAAPAARPAVAATDVAVAISYTGKGTGTITFKNAPTTPVYVFVCYDEKGGCDGRRSGRQIDLRRRRPVEVTTIRPAARGADRPS